MAKIFAKEVGENRIMLVATKSKTLDVLVAPAESVTATPFTEAVASGCAKLLEIVGESESESMVESTVNAEMVEVMDTGRVCVSLTLAVEAEVLRSEVCTMLVVVVDGSRGSVGNCAYDLCLGSGPEKTRQ